MFILLFIFVIFIIVSAFLQASDNPAKNYISPLLTLSCGILVLVGALMGNVHFGTGIVLAVALFLLFGSDFMFERSVTNENLFPIAMVLGVLSGFAMGIMINLDAAWSGIPLGMQITFFGIGVIAAIMVYRYLDVDPGLKVPVYIYLVQAVVLLAGGLSAFYVGNVFFGIWGVFIFLSDSLVGLRAFPSEKRPIPWQTKERILFAIIVLYYSAQFALVSWAL